MSSAVLSQAQFGPEPPMAGSGGDAATMQPVKFEPHNTETTSVPLPYNSQTNSSAKQASVWRKPTHNLSYSTATAGSIFTPYAGND